MKITTRQAFEKDALKLPLKTQREIAIVILAIQNAGKLSEIKSCKKLTGFKNAYRIRIGNYRIGFFFEDDTVELVRVLARKDMYRFFP
ncbi:MAG: hypothetical protein WDM90_18890 [Ferruginibacter sp.]